MPFYKSASLLFLAVTMIALSACSGTPAATQEAPPAPTEESTAEPVMNMDTMNAESTTEPAMNMTDEAHSGSPMKFPNNGAVIRIVSPADGAVVSAGDFEVEIAVENFDLHEGQNHWHVYVDETTWGMIMGGDTSYVLNGVAPGEHRISVFLSVTTHEELEDGDSITVTVEG
ncbi:MAG: DUF6130 family protein [Anaerolineae bacterium]|nr:DUF6130 family protein [Anaerolineae bacterium]